MKLSAKNIVNSVIVTVVSLAAWEFIKPKLKGMFNDG